MTLTRALNLIKSHLIKVLSLIWDSSCGDLKFAREMSTAARSVSPFHWQKSKCPGQAQLINIDNSYIRAQNITFSSWQSNYCSSLLFLDIISLSKKRVLFQNGRVLWDDYLSFCSSRGVNSIESDCDAWNRECTTCSVIQCWCWAVWALELGRGHSRFYDHWCWVDCRAEA